MHFLKNIKSYHSSISPKINLIRLYERIENQFIVGIDTVINAKSHVTYTINRVFNYQEEKRTKFIITYTL